MIKWWQQRPLLQRLLVYAVAATLAFLVAAGIGAMTALLLQGDLSWPINEGPGHGEIRRSNQQDDTPHRQQADVRREQQEKADVEQGEAASQQTRTTYFDRVDHIQSVSVETFLDSHDRLRHYDALTADDIDKMQANADTLQKMSDEVDDLTPPQKYRGQYRVIRLAVDELHETTRLAYTFAADPTAATQSGFEEYDHHVDQAATYLKTSNRMLGRGFKVIEGVHRVSRLS